MITVLDKALNIIARFESFSPTPYYATEFEKRKGLLTIGYGVTLLHGRPIKFSDKLTRVEASTLLVQDICALKKQIKALIPTTATDNQLAAMISFAYNVGTKALKDSTLLRLWHQGELIAKVADQLDRWTKQNGVVLKGLVKRREAEKKLFLAT